MRLFAPRIRDPLKSKMQMMREDLVQDQEQLPLQIGEIPGAQS